MALAAEKHLLSLDLFEVLYESIHLIAVDDVSPFIDLYFE